MSEESLNARLRRIEDKLELEHAGELERIQIPFYDEGVMIDIFEGVDLGANLSGARSTTRPNLIEILGGAGGTLWPDITAAEAVTIEAGTIVLDPTKEHYQVSYDAPTSIEVLADGTDNYAYNIAGAAWAQLANNISGSTRGDTYRAFAYGSQTVRLFIERSATNEPGSLYRSTDGISWTEILAEEAIPGGDAMTIYGIMDYDIGPDGSIYALLALDQLGAGDDDSNETWPLRVQRSTDGGETFSTIYTDAGYDNASPTITNAAIRGERIAINSTGDVILICTNQNDDSPLSIKGTLSGSWSFVQGTLPIPRDPTNGRADQMRAGADGRFVYMVSDTSDQVQYSDDDGTSWTPATGLTGQSRQLGWRRGDWGDRGICAVGSDFYISTDNWETWTSIQTIAGPVDTVDYNATLELAFCVGNDLDEALLIATPFGTPVDTDITSGLPADADGDHWIGGFVGGGGSGVLDTISGYEDDRFVIIRLADVTKPITITEDGNITILNPTTTGPDVIALTSMAEYVIAVRYAGQATYSAYHYRAAATGSSGHEIHDEVAAALTARTGLHFMGNGVFAQDNAGSTRTEVIVGTVYDAIVDSGDTNAAGKGNVYATLQAAITAGHHSILFRESTDSADIVISTTAGGSTSGNDDLVTRIVGDTTVTATVPVNIICENSGVLFDSLTFNGKTLRLAATQCRAFACIFTGTRLIPQGLLAEAVDTSETSIDFDGGAAVAALNYLGTYGGLTSGYYRMDNEYGTHTLASGSTTGSTLAANRGMLFTRRVDHSDNAAIYDIGTGHLEIFASNCEVTACFFIACTSPDTNCVYIDGRGSGARLTACVFLSNTTLHCVVTSQSNVAATGDPTGVEVVGTKFAGNTTKNALIGSWGGLTAATHVQIHTMKINGCSFSGMDFGAIAGCHVRANFAGNTFVSGNAGAGNRTNLTDFRDTAAGVLTGMASTDSAIPFDTDGGSTGTRPQMGYVEIGTELLHYSARKTGTTTGTATASSATTLTNSGAAFTPDEYQGQVLAAGTSWGIITGHTATVFTVDSWRGGTPGATAAYAVRASLVGCLRGLTGTTAAAATDNATITYRSEVGIAFFQGGAAVSAQANIVSGNTFSTVHMPVLNMASTWHGLAAAGACSVLLSGNTITSVIYNYIGGNWAYVGNMLGNQTINCLSGVNQVFAFNSLTAASALTYTNAAASALFFQNAATGIATSFRIPGGKPVELGAAAGDLTPLVIPLTNKTGANSVINQVVTVDPATNNSFVNNAGLGARGRKAVVMENGIADGSACMVAIEGVVEVLCTAANARNDVLEVSATAGQAAIRRAGSEGFATVLVAASGAGALAKVLLGPVAPITEAGTYTPTLNNTTNVAASTAYQCQYIRVGNVVSVSGKADVDPTAAAATVLGISLPIASNFGAVEDCGGVAFSPAVAGQGAGIVASVANDRAEMQWVAVDVANRAMFFQFQYEII